LTIGSALKDSGPTPPEFNDHDGSRNDMGHYGGHAHDPNGATTVNPVILSGEQSTFQVDVGDTTPIVIQARAAVTTPK
jgi:hypothetical protein